MKIHNRLIALKWLGLLVIFASTTVPSDSWAALPAYMTVTAETQGVIQGSVEKIGYEGSIEVIGFGHNISAPYNPQSGSPDDTLQHRPVRISKPIDRSTPLLATAFYNGEVLTSVIIRFIRPDSEGADNQFYTVELINARIVSMMPSHSSVTADLEVTENETVSFTYQQIITRWEDGSLISQDDW